MARTIGALCTFIVGLQVLVGVPLVICAAFFCLTNGPITVEVHVGHGHSPQFIVHGATIPPPGSQFAVAPPPNTIPTTTPTSFDNPILQSRAEHGSPLTGTLLESANPAEEQDTFITALERAVAEHSSQPERAVCPATEACHSAGEIHPNQARHEADQWIVGHLYEMAEIDERAGDYHRADQWRALAREVREGRDRQNAHEAAAASFNLPAKGDSASKEE